jgi:hypothetical protein
MPSLLSNASATGSATIWDGGRGVFAVNGTFDGSMVSLEMMGPDGTNYIPVAGAPALNSNGAAEFTCPPARIRAAVTGGGGATAVYARADKVRR